MMLCRKPPSVNPCISPSAPRPNTPARAAAHSAPHGLRSSATKNTATPTGNCVCLVNTEATQISNAMAVPQNRPLAQAPTTSPIMPNAIAAMSTRISIPQL